MQPTSSVVSAAVTNTAFSPIPFIVWKLLDPVLFMHKVWRSIKRIELYSNPENYVQLAAGHVAAHALRGTTAYNMMEVAAQGWLISNRMLDCVNQAVALSHACKQSANGVKGNFVTFEKLDWNNTPSFFSSLIEFVTNIWNRFKHMRNAEIGLESGKMVMSLLDLHAAFHPSEEEMKLITAELFVNFRQASEKFIENQKRLKTQLLENKHVVQQILLKIGMKSPEAADKLINSIDTSMEVAAKGIQAVNAGSDMVVGVAQRVVYEAADMFGVAQHLPNALVPTSPQVIHQPLSPSKTVTPVQPVKRVLEFNS